MFTQLLQPSYWFTMNPALVGGISGTMLFAFFVLMFVGGIAAMFVARSRVTDRYLLSAIEKATALLITMGLLGILLYFFSFERIRFFGARFWYPLWLIGTGVWAYSIFRFVKRDVPLKRQQVIERQEKRKYFPGRKR